ncbi:alpha-ketoacid dehydrogenase subunit alpha/beta [Deminuibacter soli]|uniref:Transketolase n=1 Tax=Deminuibacter soli TaxID=2291815 RepID=A0A3E1NDU2_9BACT|nr:alpha-ketoacid dehydrogenase subunit alpha/beta [Deminuibacter soli]RFM26014.1 transketolase [Deminuibacter soli]
MENSPTTIQVKDDMLSYEGFRAMVLADYRVVLESRETSLLGRREVLTGKAKFGIFGDGKEVAQVAMAKFFQPGDWRAGYYRDQTFMFATQLATVEQFFAQMYADPDINNEPFSRGRQMNGHFATRITEPNGEWAPIANLMNVSADISTTAGQMPRALGLAAASKSFRQVRELQGMKNLSDNGNEICFCTIGDASTSEGHFWEAVNAAGVMQVPLAIFIWDDGYGISVPTSLQTTKGSISAALKGFQKKEDTNGLDIYRLKGWDYAGMCEVFETALQKIRDTHVPAVFHIEEITQPQGHSTSGSHERYKSAERLEWEKEWDCLRKMREWVLENGIATEEELGEMEMTIRQQVRESKNRAWQKYQQPIKEQALQAAEMVKSMVVNDMEVYQKLQHLATDLENNREPLRRDIFRGLSLALETAPHSPSVPEVKAFRKTLKQVNKALYNSDLYNEGPKSALKVPVVAAHIPADAQMLNGYEVLNRYFDQLFTHNPRVLAFGEDVGKIGDVNQGFAGLQDKHGSSRIFDTGIRELTIVGQGIGLALRGLRPITEIQYLDYVLYGLQTLSDDVATLHYRTGGQQSCPLIIRTRGHRLEGIWHSGSPMGMLINSLRGMYVCVPRDMVQAIGMYNTLLQSNDPAIMVECLNGYRLKEKLPANLLEYTVPLGIPEVVREGADITVVSYGSTLRIVLEAATRLAALGIHCEVIDVQTLLPFDINHDILVSLKKTSRIVFVDEDVPGGATAYMFNHVMEQQGGYQWLDVAPRTITAQAHRPAYGSDGDYFSKPNAEDIIEVIMEMVTE